METLGPRFEQALVYASHVHAAQRRKGTPIPYLSHLLAVSALVLEDGGGEEEAIAALLHDAVEDQGGKARLADIAARFGPAAAAIVEGCSDTDVQPKPPWRLRKESYIGRLAEASPAVVRVSLADKLHNARSLLRDYRRMGEELWRRFDPEADQLWYYRALASALDAASESPLVGELEEVVSELERAVLLGSIRRLLAYGAARDYTAKHVILRGDERRGYYVQFAVDEGGLMCEAVHNKYLEPEHRLSDDQVERLLELGWEEPGKDDERSFWRWFEPASDADIHEILRLAFQALYEVYGSRDFVRLDTSWRAALRWEAGLLADRVRRA